MDTILKAAAKSCVLSGEAFASGQTVVSILVHQVDQGYQRIDCTEAAAQAYKAEGREVCRWRIKFAAPDASAAEQRKEARQTAEELFKDLYRKSQDTPAKKDEALLLNLLATHLERQKVLRSVASGIGQYLHIRDKKTYHLPSSDWNPTDLSAMISQLGPLVKS